MDVLVRELDGHLAALVKMVGRGPFFFGLDQPSVADLAVYGQLFFLYDKVTPEGQATVENHPALTRTLSAFGCHDGLEATYSGEPARKSDVSPGFAAE